MRYLLLLLWFLGPASAQAQKTGAGLITGNVLDKQKKALEGATVTLEPLTAGGSPRTSVSGSDGAFQLEGISFGWYRLHLSYTGLQALTIDSLHIREERADFNLNDLLLLPKTASENLQEVIVYAEKPLIQSKDGNITFNAGESALSAGSNASDLLASVPLVTKDPDGRILVRGKEPKILIDDKPVELNLQQLQDLLESLPGSAIEKIEVMTNPPPQYATEQGGVINIVTRKGKVGINGRLTVNAGSRGEAGTNGSINLRKQGLVANLNAGVGFNRYEGMGYAIRQNTDKDSNRFTNNYGFRNNNRRPHLRASVDYDLGKWQSFGFVLQFNNNDFDNRNNITYKNFNRLADISRLSQRTVASRGNSTNYDAHLNYTLRSKKPGEVFRVFVNTFTSGNDNNRDFYEVFFFPDGTPRGLDSTQQQRSDNRTKGYNARLSYDLPLRNKKTFLSAGAFHNVTRSDIDVQASYRRSTDGTIQPQEALSNQFRFHQYLTNVRASVKQFLQPHFSVSTGLAAEKTVTAFDLLKRDTATRNGYWNLLPFANINKTWNETLHLTVSYRRTIRRPGINEQNPTVDESDPFNRRYGNPALRPSLAHNLDLVLGKTKTAYYTNIGFGFNKVEDIFTQLRERISDSTTQTTWQNISGRREWELSTWNGYTLSRKARINFSANYTYNQYSDFDKRERAFRNGGSFSSNLNGHYNWTDRYNTTASFTFNRFANPQGTVRSNVSMNLGLQARMLSKQLVATLNIIDPFRQQQNRTVTYGTNFMLENFNTTNTRNYRLTLSYNINPQASKSRRLNRNIRQVQQAAPKD